MPHTAVETMHIDMEVMKDIKNKKIQ